MGNIFLSVENLNVTIGGVQVLKQINLIIRSGEQWALTGPSGSGKTVLARTLCGQHFFTGKIQASFGEPETLFKQIFLVEQQHRFRNLENRQDFYYQQRFNSFDSELSLTVEEELSQFSSTAGLRPGLPGIEAVADLLQIGHLLKEPLIQLSNGENKRLQLVKALLLKKRLLIMDQPFIGLDEEGRGILFSVLAKLGSTGVMILLITTPHEIPPYITHIAALEKGSIKKSVPRDYFIKSLPAVAGPLPHIPIGEMNGISNPEKIDFVYAVRMQRVNIEYGEKRVLHDLNWEVRQGEKWSVSGPNGAGKSTLLSLITADHPQAYANEIFLFDRRRGTGESIWDIKKRIGYVSPELHLYFESSSTAFQAVASGLFDTIGLFRRLSMEQEELVLRWMKVLGLESVGEKILSRLSTGEQRMVLLARALVKNPPLLILDEPCQGLDEAHTAFFRYLIDWYCGQYNTTLIYVSHFEAEVPSCVGHFLRLENGRMVTGPGKGH